MRKIVIYVVVSGIAVAGFYAGRAFAHHCSREHLYLAETVIEDGPACGMRGTEPAKDHAISLGKRLLCPVMDENVFTLEEDTPYRKQDGKKYFFCCPECKDEFAGNSGKNK